MENGKNIDFNKVELNAEYVAKDQFGFRISHVNQFIIVHLEIYDKDKRNEIIDIFRNFVNYIYEDNKEKGIKKVFLVDAKDVREHIAKNKELANKKEFVIETPDLLTGEFVPLLSKVKDLRS